MNVTHKQIISGTTTAGPLAILLSRFILWVNADSVERELRKEVEDLTERLDGVNKLLEERYESAWKVRKDGKARYRKVATKVLVNAWVTETEPIESHSVMMDVDWSTLEEERNDLRMLYHQ